MKINQRGRGKFKPAPDYDINEVKDLLLKKIEEEKELALTSTSSLESKNLDLKQDKFNLISLFSGCGGLDLGFELAGLEEVIGEEKALKAFENKETYNEIRNQSIFHTVYANDIFNEASQTYAKNFGNHILINKEDIRKIKSFPRANIVLGGFPCPGFSEAGPRLIDDKRNFLYIHFIRCLLQSQPEIFVAENVKGMMTLGKGEVFRQIKQDFEAAGYIVEPKLVNARDYGVPQIRERVILVGVRTDLGFKYKFPEETHGNGRKNSYKTLRDTIWNLVDNPGPFYEGSYSSIFMSRNRKKNWEDQSFTIQASGRQAPLHPDGVPMQKVGKDEWIFPDGEENHRRLSIKEIARIQTFPDWFWFSDGRNDDETRIDNNRLDKIYKQIGNAVPVFLARAIAKPIAKWAKEYLKNGNPIFGKRPDDTETA